MAAASALKDLIYLQDDSLYCIHVLRIGMHFQSLPLYEQYQPNNVESPPRQPNWNPLGPPKVTCHRVPHAPTHLSPLTNHTDASSTHLCTQPTRNDQQPNQPRRWIQTQTQTPHPRPTQPTPQTQPRRTYVLQLSTTHHTTPLQPTPSNRETHST